MNLKELLQKPIAFYPALAKALGGINEAILLQQLIYWSDKGSRKDGFIYKSKEEIEAETCLNRYQQDKARAELVKQGLIEVKKIKAQGAPTLHYKVNFGKVEGRLMEKSKVDQSEKLTLDQSITENTQENTTNSAERTFEDFDNKKEFKKLLDSNNKVNKIMGLYFTFVGFTFENKDQFNAEMDIQRSWAKKLTGYRSDQLLDLFAYCARDGTKNGYDWKLSTAVKKASYYFSNKSSP